MTVAAVGKVDGWLTTRGFITGATSVPPVDGFWVMKGTKQQQPKIEQNPPSLHVNGKNQRMENETKAEIFWMQSYNSSGIRCWGF